MAAHQGLKTVTYKTSRPGLRALVCLLLGAAILGVSWQVQERLGIARPFSLAPKKQENRRDTGRKSQELTLSSHTLYALQLGAFTRQDAAERLAQEFSARGAAGYVYRDGETYRVLAAAYPTRAEAQTVQTRLSAQSINTFVHPCVQEAITLRAGGTAGQVDALREAVEYLDGLEKKLYNLSTGLDNGQTTGNEGREALLSEGTTCAALLNNLTSAFDGEIPVMLSPLQATLSDIAAEAERVRGENGAARIGAALKKAQLLVFFGVYGFVESVRQPA